MCDRTQNASGSNEGRSGNKRSEVIPAEGHGWFFFVPDGANTKDAALAVKLSTSSRGKTAKEAEAEAIREAVAKHFGQKGTILKTVAFITETWDY